MRQLRLQFRAHGGEDHGAATRTLGWEKTFETDRCPTCVEAKRKLDEESAFTITGVHMSNSPDTDNYLIWSDEHSA